LVFWNLRFDLVFENLVLKGHGFSRAERGKNFEGALAPENEILKGIVAAKLLESS